MKKCIIILAVLALFAPALAAVDITLAEVESDETGVWVAVNYSVTGGVLPRAFALDMVSSDANFIGIRNFFSGDCTDDVNKGYGIFPANFGRVINAGAPDWNHGSYTPVAQQSDYPADTLSGMGTGAMTCELGSIYDTQGTLYKPAASGTLFEVKVDGSTTVTVGPNLIRSGYTSASSLAGVVMETGTVAPSWPAGLAVEKPEPPSCPFDVTDTATGFVPGAPGQPSGFNIGLWTGPSNVTNLNDLNALVALLVNEFNTNGDYELPPVAASQVCDVTDTATGFVPGAPGQPSGFNMGLWTGPSGAINLNDLNALVALLVNEFNTNGDYEWDCP